MLAVNQNGRWAPHLAWMREAVRAGLVGERPRRRRLDPLEPWLDQGHRLRGYRRPHPLRLRRPLVRFPREPDRRPRRPRSSRRAAHAAGAAGAAAADGAGARRLRRRPGVARSSTARRGSAPRTAPSSAGSVGTLNSRGPDLGDQAVTLTTDAGIARPELEGTWFKEGFRGTMGALLSAVEDGRQPLNAPAATSMRWRWSSPRSPRRGSACRSPPARSAASREAPAAEMRGLVRRDQPAVRQRPATVGHAAANL